jgi:GNAT superfamily N-acetyltransferase
MSADGPAPVSEVSVRAAEPGQWSLVRAVRLASLAESPRMFGSSLEREQAFDEATWRGRTQRLALAWLDGTVVGMAGYYWNEPGVAADLVSMWVCPAARGSGAATALIEWVIDQVVTRRGAVLELGVVSDNAIAIAVYRRNGFVDAGTTVGLHSGSTLLRMRYSPHRTTHSASE